VKLADLLTRCPDAHLVGDGGRDVNGITHDSRQVRQGELFAAIPGLNNHGLDFLPAAVAAGAVMASTFSLPPWRPAPWLS